MQSRPTQLILAAMLALAAGCLCAHDPPQRPSRPAGADWEDDDHSYDRARRANARGEILDLAEIYERVAAQVPGRVLEAELEKERGRWIYELKILDPRGRLLEVESDARTGEVLYQGENN